MHVPSPSYANNVYYNCNGVGHREFECRKKNLQSYGGRYGKYAQLRNGSRACGSQKLARNLRINVPVGARGPPVLVASHNNMTRRKWSNRYVKRFPNNEVGMDAVCYNSTTSSCVTQSINERIHKQKMVRPAPKTKMGRRMRPSRYGGRSKRMKLWTDTMHSMHR